MREKGYFCSFGNNQLLSLFFFTNVQLHNIFQYFNKVLHTKYQAKLLMITLRVEDWQTSILALLTWLSGLVSKKNEIALYIIWKCSLAKLTKCQNLFFKPHSAKKHLQPSHSPDIQFHYKTMETIFNLKCMRVPFQWKLYPESFTSPIRQ